jgi:uncharacterized protein with HEPN domain
LPSNVLRRLTDVIENAEKVVRYSAGLTEDSLFADENEMTLDAVERCLQRISEAAIVLGEEAERLIPNQPWSDIRGMGNHLRHRYHALDSEAIWEAVCACPGLAEDCIIALRQLGQN